MNKSTKELINAIAKETCMSQREVKAVFDATFDHLGKAMVSGKSVRIVGFGLFGTKIRKARIGRNPMTGESVEIPEKKIPVFHPSSTLKQSCNN